MHRVKHGPMDPCFFLPFFGPIGEGKAPWGRGCPVSPCVPCVFCVPYVPCVPCVPCLVCPVSLVSPVSLVFPVSRCVPCVPCLVCPVSPFPRFPVSPFPRVPCVPFAISKKWNVRWRCPCFMWHVARKLRWFSLLSYDNMRVFFRTRRRSKDVIFHENRK